MSFKEKIKHAFSLEPDGTLHPEELPEILERFAAQVVQRGLEIPAIMFLEMVKPLGFLGSQMVYAAIPVAGVFSSEKDLNEMARALEHRGVMTKLVSRIEQLSGCRR